MLGLILREEFRGKRLKGTAIELANENKTGATQIPAKDFLEITYPTRDILKAIEAIGPGQGRSVVIIGERGLGKSHLLAVLYHAITDMPSTRNWLNFWSTTLGDPKLSALPLRDGMLVIGESLHRQRYKFLWDLLFDRHPHGPFIRGKWEGMGASKTDIPSDKLVLELLRNQPTTLLLDEFQTWYDGLTNTKQYPWKNWAFNFIQILSEIAKENPNLLLLVTSVRSGQTDAYEQIRRVAPVEVDFKGQSAQTDRRRLLLHRLFENRLQILPPEIEKISAPHIAEYFRLLGIPGAEQERMKREFIEAWPYAPHLLQLLEDQVLVATNAQQTRDLIRILANLFKSRGDISSVLTAADFRLDDDTAGIGALLDSVANAQHATLREKALRNITSVLDAVPGATTIVPHLQEIVGALWVRSIAVGNLAGADPAVLHADITRDKAVDDNAFQVEIAAVVENSFNIHQEGARLVFKEEENPQAKLMACARNDRLFSDGSDHVQLAKQIQYVIGGSEDVAKSFRVIALPKSWLSDPWSPLDESERPEYWDDRLPILVLPEEPDRLDERLGRWLKENLQKMRNAVRFLLPRSGSENAFLDRDLIILTRAVLKAQEWTGQSSEYGKLQQKYQKDLREIIKKRYDRFAIVNKWNFASPEQSRFHLEGLKAQGSLIPDAIETAIREDLFIPEDFAELVLEAAHENSSVGKLLRELREPRPAGNDCIPWLGETLMKERVIRLAAQGKVAINLRGMEYLQAQPGEDEESAWRRMRGRLGTGKHLDETFVLLPTAVPTASGSAPFTTQPGTTPAGGLIPGATPQPGEPPTSAIGDPTGTTLQPMGVFGGTPTGVRKAFINPATSPLNLIGKLEGWGIGPATKLHQVMIRLDSATGAQVKKLLKGLPDGITYELGLEKEEDS
jgi:hypothetical protein